MGGRGAPRADPRRTPRPRHRRRHDRGLRLPGDELARPRLVRPGVGARRTAASPRSSACTRSWRCRRSACSAPRSRRSAGCRRWRASRRSAPSRSPSRTTARTPSGWRRRAHRDGDGCVLNGAQEVDRQRVVRRLRDRVGARRGRQRRRLRRREGDAAASRPGHHRQDRAALVVAGGDHARPTSGSRPRTGSPGAHSFKDTGKVLTSTATRSRGGRSASRMAAYELARRARAASASSSASRSRAFQLVQDKLSRMLAEVTTMQLLCWRRERPGRRGPADRRHGVAGQAQQRRQGRAARRAPTRATSSAANGILLENHVARHFADMEAVFTFEGTDSDPVAHRRPRDHRAVARSRLLARRRGSASPATHLPTADEVCGVEPEAGAS